VLVTLATLLSLLSLLSLLMLTSSLSVDSPFSEEAGRGHPSGSWCDGDESSVVVETAV
jgi:hypothetical protein